MTEECKNNCKKGYFKGIYGIWCICNCPKGKKEKKRLDKIFFKFGKKGEQEK